jgi:hypothetical protein
MVSGQFSRLNYGIWVGVCIDKLHPHMEIGSKTLINTKKKYQRVTIAKCFKVQPSISHAFVWSDKVCIPSLNLLSKIVQDVKRHKKLWRCQDIPEVGDQLGH